jgi:uncharacterized protein YecE (DUF72 family)
MSLMKPGKLFIGTSGWSYKDWVGPFYPEGTKAADYLSIYTKKYNTVEVDSTFYGIPRETTVQKWAKVSANNFVFSPKVPQEITHELRLEKCDHIWERYLNTMRILGPKLGPIVLQFDYKFKYKEHFEVLEHFLHQHAQEARLCVEIRNRDWHQESFYEMLAKFNTALILNDLYYMPRIVKLTANFTYIRLLGNRKQIPDDFSHARVNRDKDLDWWAKWINRILERELEVYVYSNNRYQGHAPTTIEQLQGLLCP